MAKVGEAPPNWLSEIVEEKRQTIDRIIPIHERRAERDAIVEAIKSDPKGVPLAANSALPDVVWAALGVANERDREVIERPDLMAPSAAIKASWFVFKELGLPIP